MSARTWFQRAQGSAMSYLQEKINSLSSASAKYERYQKYAGNPLRTLAKVSKNKGKNRSTGKTAAAVVGATTGVSVAGLLAAPLAVPAAGMAAAGVGVLVLGSKGAGALADVQERRQKRLMAELSAETPTVLSFLATLEELRKKAPVGSTGERNSLCQCSSRGAVT